MSKFFVCSECGSADIVYEATAAWKFQTQDWEVDDVHLGGCCNACGTRNDGYEIEVDEDGEISFLHEHQEQDAGSGFLEKVGVPKG